MKYYLDCNFGDKEVEDKFKEVNEVYEVFFDVSKWVVYDQYGYVGVDLNMGGGVGVGFGGVSFFDIFGDVFSDFFGGGGVCGGLCGGVQCGVDLCYILDFDLEEVVCGIIVIICVLILVGCKICNGSGVKFGIILVICIICGGIGQVCMQQGFFLVQQICLCCYGIGKMIFDFCGFCYGQGCVEEQKILLVKVLVGVDIGDCICFIGEGEVGSMGGLVGDLYVVVNVCEYLIFQCDGKYLYCEVLISFVDVVLGGELEVLILDGWVKLKILESIQIGKLFCLCGKGVVLVCGGGVGDLMCKVVVEILVNLDKCQCELFEEFCKLLQSDILYLFKVSGWFEGMKCFFDDL